MQQWHPTPVLLPGKSHGRRNLVGCSPWIAKSCTWPSDFTFTFHFQALEKEMATHSSVLAWRIPGTGEAGGLPSMRLHRVGHDWSDLAAAADLTYKDIFVSLRQRREQKTWILSGIELKLYSSSTWADWVENSEFLRVTEIANGKAFLIAKVILYSLLLAPVLHFPQNL